VGVDTDSGPDVRGAVCRYVDGRWDLIADGLEPTINGNVLLVLSATDAWLAADPGLTHFADRAGRRTIATVDRRRCRPGRLRGVPRLSPSLLARPFDPAERATGSKIRSPVLTCLFRPVSPSTVLIVTPSAV
jgi:hypothetical protein